MRGGRETGDRDHPDPNAPATSRAIENDRADVSMYDVVLVDQVVKTNPDKFERAYYSRTNIRIGVAVKKETRSW